MSDNSNPFGASFGNTVQGSTGGGTAGSFASPSGNPANAGNSSAMGAVKDVTTAEFMTEVIEASQHMPVLVDFWAPWCGPCKQLAPALEKVVAEFSGKVKLVKMDIDKHPEVAGQMGIQSIPAVVAFAKGQPADAFMGAKPESEIRQFVEKLAGPSDEGSQIDAALEQAEGFAGDGNLEMAANLYIQVLQATPDNLRALTGLGKVHVENDDLSAAKSALEAIPAHQTSDPAVLALQAAIELKEQASALGDTSELEARIAADASDHQARIDLAIALNAGGRRNEAATQLLESIKLDRSWNEEAARAQLLQFFDAWGPMDDASKSARRQLSSLLFS